MRGKGKKEEVRGERRELIDDNYYVDMHISIIYPSSF